MSAYAGIIAGTLIGDLLSDLLFSESGDSCPPSEGGGPAPGKPTEEDGFYPPKNADKDGRVKNPNGPGKGWPDSKGNVWVPTGGKAVHGGEHWDVQIPGRGVKPGKHVNVYPGGHVR